MKVEYASQPLADASDAGSSRVVEDAPVAVVGDTVLGDTVGDAVGAVPPSPPPPVHAVASRSIPLTATKALTLVRSMGTLIPRGALLAITGRLRSAPSARKRCTTSNRGDHPEQALLPSWPLPHSPSNMSSESASRPSAAVELRRAVLELVRPPVHHRPTTALRGVRHSPELDNISHSPPSAAGLA